jgi:hypothetical protein
MAVPHNEIPGMTGWLSGDREASGEAKSRYSVAAIRGMLIRRLNGATVEDVRASARKWSEVLAPAGVAL